MEKFTHKGFTLVELMVALSVASVLLGVGIPSFAEMIANSRVSANYNSIAQALYIARSEAIKSSEQITVCPREVGTADACGTDWNDGILVFVDNPPVNSGTAATLNAEDVVLHSQGELKEGSTLTAYFSTDRTAATKTDTNMLVYQPSGQADWANGTFQLCDDDRGDEYARALNVVVTGNLRKGRPVSSTSKVPANVFGTAVSC